MWRRVCAGVLAAAVSVIVVVGSSSAVYADEVRDGQWYLDDLGVSEAHELSRGAGVKIGLIDSGVDAEHPDVDGAVEAGTGLGSAEDDGLDDARNHGTGMASILAGRGHGDDGADGILGIAPEATVVSVGVESGEGSEGQLDDAIRWLADAEVDVISVSMSGAGGGSMGAIREATDAGIPIVASAGNKNQDGIDLADTNWPAKAPGVIPVSGTNQDGEFWDKSLDLSWAAEQPQLGLSAPATDLPAAEAGGGYATNSGTSGSVPIVAGTLALIKSAYPDLSYYSWLERLLDTVDDQGDKGFDDKYGWGIVNPLEALTAETSYQGPDGEEISDPDDILPLEEQGRESGDGGEGDAGTADGGSDAGVLTGSSGVSWLPVAVVAGAVVLAAAIITPIVVSRSRNKKRAAVAGGSSHPDGFSADPLPPGFPAGPPGGPPGPGNTAPVQPAAPTPEAPAPPPSAPPQPAGSDSPWAPPSPPSDSDRQ